MALSDDQKDLLKALEREARLRREISSSLTEYSKAVNDSKKLEEEISSLYGKRVEEVRKLRDMRKPNSNATAKEKKQQEDIVAVLRSQYKVFKQNKTILDNIIKGVDKYQLTVNKGFTKGSIALIRNFTKLDKVIEGSYAKLKGSGLLEMDKAMKKTALSIGLAGENSKRLRFDIESASENTIMFGANIEELAQYQADYSEELGRSVLLGQKGLEAIAEMAKGTTLGAEGAAKMAAEFEMQGVSAERTKDFIEEAVNKAGKLGINASKVIKNIQSNFKLMNKYNFKGGTKGLQKMAETTTKLGIDMNSVSGMADKLFDIEGAVEMSAQLQVLGGAWANLGDPFKLMYMARNDMAGLTEEIGKAAASTATFNSESGEFDITAMEMHRLRKVAESTGLAYDDLATAAKNAAKFSKIKTQVSFTTDKDTKEFLSNSAQLDKNGKAFLYIKGDKKFLNELNQQQIKEMMANDESLKERAKAARTFDETFTNTVNLFKTALLPLVEEMEPLGKGLDDFVKQARADGWFSKIKGFADKVGKMVTVMGKFVLENPILSAFTFFGTKILFNTASWFLNGISLSQGFRTGLAGDGILGMAKGFATAAGPIMGSIAGTAIGLYLGKNLGGWLSTQFGNKDTATGDISSIIGGIGGGIGGGALLGSEIGTALAPFTGGLSIPIGFALGAGVGALGGSAIGKIIGDYAASDAMFNSPVKDGMFGGNNLGDISTKFGPNYSQNRGILQGGKITPIDNKDDVLAMKPGGMVDKMHRQSSSNIVKHEFGDITINGKIEVTVPGNPSLAVDLMKNPEFIRELQIKITEDIKRKENQVTKKG